MFAVQATAFDHIWLVVEVFYNAADEQCHSVWATFGTEAEASAYCEHLNSRKAP